MRIPRFVRRAGTRFGRFLLQMTGEAALDRVADTALERLRREQEKEEQEAIRKEAREQFYRELEARTMASARHPATITVPAATEAALAEEMRQRHARLLAELENLAPYVRVGPGVGAPDEPAMVTYTADTLPPPGPAEGGDAETAGLLYEADPPLPNRELEAAVQEHWGDYPVVAAQTRARVRALLAAKRPASEITRAIVGRQTIIE